MKKLQGSALYGSAMIVLSGVCWSFAGVLSRLTSWNSFSVVGFRALIASIMMGINMKSFRPVNTLWNWLGGLSVIATGVLFICANRLTSSANAIVLQYAMTAIVIGLQILLFRMRPRKRDIWAAVFVMAGVLMCFFQGFASGGFLGDVLALVSAVTWAFVFIASRMPGADAQHFSYQGNLIGMLFLASIPFDAGVRDGGWTSLLVVAVMGICLGLGYICFGKGMNSDVSPASAAVLANVEPVLNPTWSFLFMGENPGLLSILGALVVLGTVTVYSIRNTRPDNG